MNQLANKIRKIREVKGYSQEYMALKLELSQRAYSRMEKGETKLSWERIKDISTVLEIDPVELVSADGSISINFCNNSNNHGRVETLNYNTDNEMKEKLLEEVDFLKQKIDELMEQNSKLISLLGAGSKVG